MSYRLTLPTDKKALSDALNLARSAAWGRRNSFYLMCQIAYHYLQGVRRFRVSSFEEARLQIGYENDLGTLHFRNEDLRNKYRTELGRYMRMDISPVVSKVGWGIDSLRKASIGQVAVDYRTRFIDFNSLKSRAFQQFLTFGTVGFHHTTCVDAKGDQRDTVEVVPPWELFPTPGNPAHPDELRCTSRYRQVPLPWLKKRAKDNPDLKLATGKEGERLMQVREVPAGQPVRSTSNDDTQPFGLSDFSQTWDTSSMASRGDKGKEKYAPLMETWVHGPDMTVARYIVKVGDHIAMDEDYYKKGLVVPCPLAVARHTPDCGWYSTGFVTGLIPMNHQVEKMLARLFKNVQDLDTYGALFWPLSAGAGVKEFERRDGGPKVITYEPDYATQGRAQPFVVAPYNTGDTPGKLVSLGNQLQDKFASQGPQFTGGAPGRVDSAAGLGFLFEVGNIALSSPSHELANAFSQMYRSILFHAKQDFKPGDSLLLTNITDDIAGVKIGENGEVSIADNPLPDYWEVEIDIKDRQPKSTEQQKQELLGMLQLQVIDRMQFRIENQRHNLGFITGNRAEWEQWRKAVFNNVLMFGDGKQPGGSVYSPIHDNKVIFLMALTDFTSRLEFSLAEKPVREQFERFKMMLQDQMAGFPEGAAGIEDLSAMAGGGQGGPSAMGTGAGDMTNPNPMAEQMGPGGFPGAAAPGGF